ncbi:retention module-containing protein [Marinomonas epiphytica]
MSDSLISEVASYNKPIGYLKLVEGVVEIHSADGSQNLVNENTMVFVNDVLHAGDHARGQVVFFNNIAETIYFNPKDVINLEEVLSEWIDLQNGEFDPNQDVLALQQAILSGEDPTQIQEAPAAGEESAAYNEQSVSVNVDRNSSHALAGFGFDTEGSHIGYLQLPSFGYQTTGLATNRLVQDSIEGSTQSVVSELTYFVRGAVPAGFQLDAASGVWVFDQTNSAYQSLGQGEQQVLPVTIAIQDQFGNTINQVINITITGSNDIPEVVSTITETASEAGPVVTGTVGATDVDTNDTLSYSATNLPAGFSLNETTGAWSFDPTDAAYDALGVGETQNLSVDVTVSDGNGGSATQTINLTVSGSNDVPEVVSSVAESASEAGPVVTGRVGATDVDTNDTLSYSATNLPAGFSLNETTGAWSFDPTDSAYDSLGVSDTQNLSVDVTVSDGNGGSATQTINLTVSGSNDVPEVVSSVAESASEAGPVVTGTVGATDVDANDTLTYSATNLPAGFSLNETTGAWSFDPTDAAYDALGVGETQNLSVEVTVGDGNGGTATQTINLTVSGSNDVPEVVSSVAESASEAGPVVTGTVGATDVDTNDTLTYSATNLPAGFSLNKTTGAWSFDPTDAAYDALGVGETQNLSIDVTVSDGNGGSATQTINLTVSGSNDIPEVVSTITETASEAGPVVSGVVSATDVDTNDTLSYSATNLPAGFSLNETTGAWSFDPTDAAYDALGVGDTQNLSVEVTVSDGNGGSATQTINLTVSGSNDEPVAVNDIVNVLEDSNSIAIDVLSNDTDLDGDVLTLTEVSIPVEQGVVSIVNNQVMFTPAANFHGSATINYSVTDGIDTTSASVNVSVQSVDDLSTISGDTSSFVYEEDNRVNTEGLVYTVGTLTINDIDSSTEFDTEKVASIGSTVGSLSITSSGSWTYTVDAANDLQHLALGQTLTENFVVTTTDGVSETISVVVRGQDDKAVIAQPNQQIAFSEDIPIPAIPFSLSISDIDDGDNPVFESITIEGEYGTLIYVESASELGEGTWAYHYDIARGQTLEGGIYSERFILTATDGSEYKITVNINGLNDTPEVAATVEHNVDEGSEVLLGSVNASDIDSDELSYHVVGNAPDGFTLNNDGSWSFDPSHDQYASLLLDEVEQLVIDVEVSDGENTVTQQISLNVIGTNSQPLAMNDANTFSSGLVGEYYGTNSQIRNIADFRAVVDSKEADATFIASNIDYQIGSGGVAKGTNLQTFLGDDNITINVDPENYSDGGLHLNGYIYLEAGTYNFKVYSDDGYQILVNEEDVASVNRNQAPKTDIFDSFTVTESGYQSVNMVWWDQGGRYVFQPKISSDGGNTYSVIDASMLSSSAVPPLTTMSDRALEIRLDTLLENDLDSDGDLLNVTGIHNVQNGYAYISESSVVRFIPSPGFDGAASFDYTVEDGEGGFSSATVAINVSAPDGHGASLALGEAPDFLIGSETSDVLVGTESDNVIFGGDDEASDELTSGAGQDVFIVKPVSDVANLDTITDFDSSQDALDLTSLLEQLDGKPTTDSSTQAIKDFLEDSIQITEEGDIKIEDMKVANFVKSDGHLDSNGDGVTNGSDGLKVIYNNEEFVIGLDG